MQTKLLPEEILDANTAAGGELYQGSATTQYSVCSHSTAPLREILDGGGQVAGHIS